MANDFLDYPGPSESLTTCLPTIYDITQGRETYLTILILSL